MPRLAPFLLVALLAAPSFGQAPAPDPAPPVPPAPKPTRIVLPDSILPYRLVRIAVEGDFDSSVFFLEPAELADSEDSADGRSVVVTGPPGRYTVQAVTIKGGKLGKARAVFVIPGPIPDPTPAPDDDKPKPKPDPPAPPAPIVSGVINASLVVDLDTLTPELAALRQGINVRAAFPSTDEFIYRTYASASPDVTRLNLKPYVDKVGGPPAFIVQSADGRVVAAEKAPATEAEMIARIRQLKGGR